MSNKKVARTAIALDKVEGNKLVPPLLPVFACALPLTITRSHNESERKREEKMRMLLTVRLLFFSSSRRSLSLIAADDAIHEKLMMG